MTFSPMQLGVELPVREHLIPFLCSTFKQLNETSLH